jgi:putative transposase
MLSALICADVLRSHRALRGAELAVCLCVTRRWRTDCRYLVDAARVAVSSSVGWDRALVWCGCDEVVQFLVELAGREICDLVEMNRLFAGCVETAYHRRVHSETKQTPLDRFITGGPFPIPTPAQLHEAFLWSEHRTVTKTATVSVHGNIFEVDVALVGRKVECVFDPFDLTAIEIRYQNRSMGAGVPHRIGRHTHPMAKPEPELAPAATEIDYLALLADRHADELATLTPPIDYTALTDTAPIDTAAIDTAAIARVESTDPDQCASQLHIPTSTTESDHR